MKANTKYLASDGYENFMCPFTEFKITQGENTGTHLGTRAVDFASGTAGYRAPYYAPATVVCVMTVPASGQAMWRTVNKVHCPNGYFGIVTFVTVHDDTFDAYVGLQVPQGNQLGNMGTKGYATGVHCHIEFIQASCSSANWVQNRYGIWTFNGTESWVDDTFYVNDTNIITPMQGNWRKCTSGSGYSPSQLIKEHGIAHFTNETPIICHRDSPTGPSFGYYTNGESQEYTEKWVGNGHRYISWLYELDNSIRCFVAVSGSEKQGVDPWATFSAPDEVEEKPSTGGYSDSQLEQENGVATFTRDNIIIRKDTPTGIDTGRRFMAGDKQEYTSKWVGNGHRYISWVENGTRYFCAVSGSETRGEDPWATFSAPEEDKPSDDKPTEDDKPSEDTPADPVKEFPDSVKMKGLDLSEHNNVNETELKKYDFVILRSNWWTTEDKRFEVYVKKLNELGIPFGVYCYDYAGDEESALEQAKYTYEMIKDLDVKMGVWMDMEDADAWKSKNGYLNKEHCSMICKVFCDFFKEKGYYTGIYSTKWWFENYIGELGFSKWVANWGTNDGTCQSDFSDYAVMHQYTSNPLDKDVAYHEVDFYKSNPIKEEEPPKEDVDKPSEPVEDDKPTDEPNTPPEEEKPSDAPNEGIDVDKVNTLLDILINIGKAIIEFFKRIFGINNDSKN